MVTELRVRNQSQQLYVRALYSAYRNGIQVYDPSVTLVRDPEAVEKMLRDADIAHAVGFRKHLIAGRQWTLQPKAQAKDKQIAAAAIDIGTRLLGEIEHFTQARLHLSSAFLTGARYARIHGFTRIDTIGDGKPRVWWFPKRLEDLDKRTYRIVAKNDGKAITAHWERFDLARGDWMTETEREAVDVIRHTYQDDQASLGHGRGLLEALGWWWNAKANVFAESLQAVERFAQGIVHAKIDGVRDADTGKPNEELIRLWQDVLTDLKGRNVLVSDKSDDIEVIQGNSEGWQLMKDIRDELRTTIHTLVLGANLTTSADKGGSYALAEVQENSTEALVQFDRETLEESLTKGLIGAIWFHNYANLRELGVEMERPRFNIKQEKRLDPQARATVAEIAHRMGLPLAMEDVYEQIGFRQPQEGEEVLAGATAPAPGMGPPGMGGGDLFGLGSGFGNLGGSGGGAKEEKPAKEEAAA